MSPCSSRTASPFFRSMAGNRIMGVTLPLVGRVARRAQARRAGWGSQRSPLPARDLRSLAALPTRGRASSLGRFVALRLPPQKVRDQRQPKLLALLRMELRADHVVVADDRGQRPAIIGLRNEVICTPRPELEAVHEIGMQAVAPDWNPVEQLVRLFDVER